jgi:hypothetical protein
MNQLDPFIVDPLHAKTRWRYSLWKLFALTTFVGVLLGVFVNSILLGLALAAGLMILALLLGADHFTRSASPAAFALVTKAAWAIVIVAFGFIFIIIVYLLAAIG